MAQTKQFSLLLLYDKVAASLSVAQALKEKDIEVQIVQSASELIQAIATKKIDMVGLSVNHTSTTSLIQVLKDKTKIQVLIFGEDKNPQTIKKIEKADGPLKITGIANGYNIFMKIGFLVKQKEKETDNARSILLTGGGETNVTKRKKQAGAFIVKGKNKTKQKNAEESSDHKQGIKQNQEPDDELLNQEEIEQNQQEETHAAQKQKGKNFTQEQPEKVAPRQQALQEASNEVDEEVHERQEKKRHPGALLFKKKKVDKDSKFDKRNKDVSKDALAAKQKPHPLGVGGTIVFSDESAAPKKVAKPAEAKEGLGSVSAPDANMPTQESNVIDLSNHKKKPQKKAGGAWQGYKGGLAPSPIGSVKNMDKNSREPVTPMVKLKHKKLFKDAVLKAGETAFNKSGGLDSFGSVSRVCIVPVINPKEKGFLLFCVNDNQFLTESGLESFKLKLYEEMKIDEVGEFILGETFNIETFEVNIADWADKSCQFSYSFEEEVSGKQVFIGFMKRDSLYPDFKQTEEPNGVYRVHVHTMPPMLPVSFDVFLYFIKNKRLIPYIKKGGSFTAKQLQRLYKRGFKYLYVSEKERNEFLSFYISLSINQDFQAAASRKLA